MSTEGWAVCGDSGKWAQYLSQEKKRKMRRLSILVSLVW